MTEGLGGFAHAHAEQQAELEARSGPQWIAPICVWLASPESLEVTGRVFEASGSVLAVAESWRNGPTAEPVLDPEAIGPIAMDLAARARPNADMQGQDQQPHLPG